MAIPLRNVDGRVPSKAYQYAALGSENTIRLLRLKPGSGSRITCSLHHHDLDSAACPAYRAMSYTWGRSPAEYEILLSHNRVILVRWNLRDALRALRDVDSACWLWIDAICIDQESVFAATMDPEPVHPTC